LRATAGGKRGRLLETGLLRAEETVTLLLINMQELKRVPGRKTDVKDSEWLAQLLECGLLKASFVRRRRSGNCAT
jgi:hypothetical protein